jgi:hypothetical protein
LRNSISFWLSKMNFGSPTFAMSCRNPSNLLVEGNDRGKKSFLLQKLYSSYARKDF